MTATAATPQGLWAATGTSAQPTPSPTGDISAEVAIIGGGFSGLSAALHLAEQSVDVVLLEAEAPGWGASGRNGGQVIAGLKLDPREMTAAFGVERGQALHRLGATTADLVYSLIERFQIRCEAHRDGWLQAAHSSAVLKTIAARVADLQAQGEDVEYLDHDSLTALTGTPYYRGAMLDRRCGTVQPLSYARGLAAAATASGARLIHDTRVHKLTRNGTFWHLQTSRQEVRAKQVLIATNAYLGDLYPALKTAMIPIESIQIATDPLPADLGRRVLPSRLPLSDMMDLGVYLRRDDEGRFIIGGRGSLTGTAGPALFAGLTRAALLLYPELKASDFTSRWGGRLALTLDHLPRLVTLEHGLHAVYGCNGRGVALMTMMGKLAADRMRGIRQDDLPVATLPPKHYPLHGLRLPVMMAVQRFQHLRRVFARG